MKINLRACLAGGVLAVALLLIAEPAMAQVVGGGGGDVFTSIVQFFRSNWMRGLVMFVFVVALIGLMIRALSIGWAVCIMLACGGLGMLDALVGLVAF
jgi:hypothetical protein